MKIHGQWIPCGSPQGGSVGLLAQCKTTKALFAGTTSGLWRKKADTDSWQSIQSYKPASTCFPVFLGSQMFVGGQSGIFKSENDGDSYSFVSLDTTLYSNVYGMYSNDTLLSLFNGYSFSLSEDSGKTFQNITSSILDWDMSAGNNITIYMGRIFIAYIDTNYKIILAFSDDKGLTWDKPQPNSFFTYQQNARFRIYNDKIYLILYQGIYESADWGNTWNQINVSGIPYYSPDDLYISNDTIVISNGSYIFASVNGWNNFYQVTNGLPPRSYSGSNFFGFLNIGDTTLLLGSNAGIFLSRDKGLSWQEYDNELSAHVISTLIGNQNGPNALFASTASSQVFYTLDEGFTWEQLTDHTYQTNSGLLEFDDLSIVGEQFVAHNDSGYYSSCNYGFNWHKGYWGFNNVINDNGIFYASTGYYLYKSTDEGVSWNTIFQSPSSGSLRLLEAKSNIILATAFAQAGQPPNQYFISWLIKSIDGGQNFTSDFINGYTAYPTTCIAGTKVFQLATYGLYVSNDTAKSFHQDSTFLNQRIAAIYTYQDSLVFISNYDSSIFISPNMGASWTDITDNFMGRATKLYLYGKYIYAVEGSSNIWKKDVSSFLPVSNNETSGLQIYPVPSSGIIRVKLPADYFHVKSYEIKAYDIMGRIVFKTSTDFWGEPIELNLDQLSKGVYVISLRDDKGVVTKGKVIRQ